MTGVAVSARSVFGAAVELGAVPDAIADPVIDTPPLQANQREALLRIDRVGRFHVRDGWRIVAEPVAGTPTSILDTWLSGTVAALVLVQRRRFALHASTVRLDGSLVAVSGASGSGKSTTVGLLAARGHPVVTDDVTAIDTDCAGSAAGPAVTASGRRLRLWPATAARLGYDPAAGRPVAPGSDKRAFAIVPSPGPDRLGMVVALRVCPHLTVPVVRRLGAREAIASLLADTYRSPLRVLFPGPHLRWMARIAAAVPIVRLDRPAGRWSGEEVVTAIERAARLGSR